MVDAFRMTLGRIRVGIERNTSESKHTPGFPDEVPGHKSVVGLHKNTRFGPGRLRSIAA